MSGRCVQKLPHSCGSSDGLQVFQDNQDKYTGYCFACDTYVDNPYPKGVPKNPVKLTKTPEEIQEEMSEIAKYPALPLPDRKLDKDDLNAFGVKIGVSEQDGVTPIFSYFPYTENGRTVRYKVKMIGTKRMWWVGHKGDVDLFGWEQAVASGSRKLFITEGEEDAVALRKALVNKSRGTKWADRLPAVASLINGSGSVTKDLTRLAARIRGHFQEVVFVFDQDKPGEQATKDAMLVLPFGHGATIPAKDANECVMSGRSKALAESVLFRSQKPKNTRLVWGTELYEAAREVPSYGLPWPWEGMTKFTRGLRYGETYYIGAGVKMGKSEIVNALSAHLMVDQGLKVFLAKPEEANKKTIKLVLSKVVGKIFHDPNIEVDFDAYDKAASMVGDKLCLLNLYQHLGWDTLRADIQDAAAQGCKAIFIDPVTNLTNGIASGEANTVLQGFAQELSAIALDLELMIFIFCHLKAPDSGAPHEQGGRIYSNQFAGSRAMMRSCNYMIGLEGNKDPSHSEEDRNMRKMIILEDREYGVSDSIWLYWDKNTALFNEVKEI